MVTTDASNDASTIHSQDGVEQNLTFIVDGEEYGVDILRVQGIQGWDYVTPIPNTPDYVLGVLNLRGAVVPIFDLRRRFKLDEIPFGPTTVVIIVRIDTRHGEKVVGMVVDAVSEVYMIDEQAIKPAPDFGSGIDIAFVRGLATVEQKMVILLDIDHLLDIDDAAPSSSGEGVQEPDAQDRAVA